MLSTFSSLGESQWRYFHAITINSLVGTNVCVCVCVFNIVVGVLTLQGYDISFLITNFHTEQMYKHKLVDFVVQVGHIHSLLLVSC